MIEVMSDTPLASVQDLGRFGHLGQGVGTAGAMDALALSAGNLMLGNEAGAAAIEVQVFPFSLRFSCAATFALTGADAFATLDGQPLLPWWVARAEAGQVLTFNLPRHGVRAYLCLAGGVPVPEVLGSRSTQLRGAFGGFEGRQLCQGDRLPLAAACDRGPGGFGIVAPSQRLPLACDGLPAVRVIPAAEYAAFEEASQQVLWQQPWKITPQSNRYGYRLAGTGLVPRRPLEMQSHGIVPGVIQVPHGGQPIIQLRDAQPMGGYPKIGAVIEADLWRLSHIPLGGSLRFIQADYPQGLAALDEQQAWLASVRDSAQRLAAVA